MKVLIINPIIRKRDKPRHIPHGLAIIANLIRDKLDITPEFLDINGYRYSDRKVEHIIDDIHADVVLIGGLTPVYNNIIKISRYIRDTYPKTTIIAGGSVASPLPEVLLRNSEVDIICTGEGERTTIELLKNIRRRDIKGIAYMNEYMVVNEQEDLITDLDKESALPAYDLLPMEIYLNNQKIGLGRDIDFISSRGCPWRCSFCYQPWGKIPRLHSPQFIINAIKYLKKKYDIDFITFMDDEFIINKKRVREFCDLFDKLNTNILWSCNGRANILARDEDLMKRMKKSGCVSIGYGFESGSQRMLDSMHKRQTIEEMEKVTELNRKYGMPIPVSFIIGMPGETKETTQETVDFCLRNSIPLDSLMYATPYPGTEIFDFGVRTNRISDIDKFLPKLKDARDFIVNLTDDFTDEELISTRTEMMDITRKSYEEYISMDEIFEKMKILYGELFERSDLDEKDLEHRFKHGGINIF